MKRAERTDHCDGTTAAAQAYLLGRERYEDVLALQRRLVYDVAGGDPPTLVLCEHEPIITVGRHGSYAHLPSGDAEAQGRRWPIRWVNRGAGFWLHLPGQIALYAILPLPRMGLSIGSLQRAFQGAVADLLADYDLRPDRRPRSCEVWVHGRPLASVGLAVRDWVSYYGLILNVGLDLEPFRHVRTGKDHPPMTSLERECRRLLRIAHVRQRLLETLAERLGFERISPYTGHFNLVRRATPDALAASRC